MTTKPKIIIITGPGASGKSTICAQVVESNPLTYQTVGIDNYWKDHSELSNNAKQTHNLDEPKAYDCDLLEEHIKQFINQKSFKPPQFCFDSKRVTISETSISPEYILLLEGTMAAALPVCREHASTIVYVDTPLDVCLCRRILRRRSQHFDDVSPIIDKYMKFIRPGYLKYIANHKYNADLILTGEDLNADCKALTQHITQI